MIKNLFEKPSHDKYDFLSPCVLLLQPVDNVNSAGQVVKTSEFRPFNIAEALAPFKTGDFSISSITAVGAFDKLKTTYMSFTSSLNVADSFENLNLTLNETVSEK